MPRSVKKGPFIHYKLFKMIKQLNDNNQKKIIKTWSRASIITPDFVGHTIAVHNGNKMIPIFITENMVGHKLGEFAPTRIFVVIPELKPKNQLKQVNQERLFTMEARAINRFIGSSPRKMRLVIDLIRGESVDKALEILHFSPKHSSKNAEKTLRSAVSNLINNKEETIRIEPADLFVKEAFVDVGPILKRISPAPQGRAYRIRKRSCHLTIVVAKKA